MTRLLTINESLAIVDLNEAFSAFVNEATPRHYDPSHSRIKKAIKNRKYVGIFYEEEGDPDEVKVLSGFRLIEPLVFGRGYKKADGQVSHVNEFYLRAYVIKESKKAQNKQLHKIHRKSVSKTRRVPYFRLFKYERIKMWEELRFTIVTERELYNPEDKMIAEIQQAITFHDE